MGTYIFISKAKNAQQFKYISTFLLICNKYINTDCKGNEYAIGIIGICNLCINIYWKSTKCVLNVMWICNGYRHVNIYFLHFLESKPVNL